MFLEEMIESQKKKIRMDFSGYTSSFYDRMREEQRLKLEKEIQEKINEAESPFLSRYKIKQKREKKYNTELGTILLKRTAFKLENKWEIPVDKILELPERGYSIRAEELGCVLGITTDFEQAKNLYTKWTGIEISNHGLSNRIEEIGEKLYKEELEKKAEGVDLVSSILEEEVCKKEELERVYMGCDGIMVPTKKEGYKEGKVGVIFSEKEHISIKGKRNYIKKKTM